MKPLTVGDLRALLTATPSDVPVYLNHPSTGEWLPVVAAEYDHDTGAPSFVISGDATLDGSGPETVKRELP